MSEQVLITGGGGFIGRAGMRELPGRRYEVRIPDRLIEQVHGNCERAEDLPDEVERIPDGVWRMGTIMPGAGA